MKNNVHLDFSNHSVAPLGFDDSREKLSDRLDQATVSKTMRAAQSISNRTGGQLPVPVAEASAGVEKAMIEKEIDEMVPRVMTAIENLDEGIEPDANLVVDINRLVGRILTLLNKMSEKSKTQLKQLEDEYRKLTLESANIERSLGSHGLKVAFVSFAVSLLGIASLGRSEIGMKADQPFVDVFVKDFIPGFGNMWKAPQDATMHEKSSSAQLKLQKIQMQSSETQSEQGKRQQAEDLVNKANRMLEAATQSR